MLSARKLLAHTALASCLCALHPDVADLTPPAGRMNTLPARTLWVWERPEDLSSIDPRTTAIATLDRTLVLGRRMSVVPRRQSYLYPAGTRRIAVVRIEAPGTIAEGMEPFAAEAILDVAGDPAIAALQIDFDARRSQREFYTALLRDLRRRMPPSLPLSITALASWCSSDDWIAALPVDEAVPMLFRMEPGRRFARPGIPEFRIREPLCESSIGVSTREPTLADLAGKRVYVFADAGWREDLPLVSTVASVERTQP
jgi:hypothetical protein